MPDYVITLGRGYGSNGRHIAHALSEKLDIAYYDHDLIQIASDESGVNVRLFGKVDETVKRRPFKRNNSQIDARAPLSPSHSDYTSSDNLYRLQANTIRHIASEENCIIVGRCADYVLKDLPNLFRVYVYAAPERCANTVAVRYGISVLDAMKQVEKFDNARGEYYRYNTGRTWNDPYNYDLCINSTMLSVDQCANLIIEHLKISGKIGKRTEQ